MLMAVVLCLSLFTTGALAASGEVETAAPVEAVEEAAPVEEAASVEEAEPAAQSAGVPVPLDGAEKPTSGVVIEGYGGTVVYDDVNLLTPGPTAQHSWGSPTPTDCNYTVQQDTYKTITKITINCGAGTKAGTYSFSQPHREGHATYEGEFSVLSLTGAKTAGKVSCDVLEISTYRSIPGESPAPQKGAKVALYTSDPSKDATATPAATFTSDSYGAVRLTEENIPEAALPKGEGNAKTFYLKEIEVPEGYAPDDRVEEVTYTAVWETNSDGATTTLKFELPNKWGRTFTSLPLTYKGFDLFAWAKENVTETGFDKELLDGVKFGVYSDEACTTLVKEFTTDENGKATIDPEEFKTSLPKLGDEPKTFYLKQTGAQMTTDHGERPMSDKCWTLTASVARERAKVTTTLSLAGELTEDEWKDGELWVENERYTSLSFDLVKQVVKTDKTVSLGENCFDFAIVPCTFGDSALAYPELVFTPEGGSPVVLSGYTTEQIGGNAERVYKVSLAVDGAGTAKATVTMQGWESELRELEVYEIGNAPQDWEYADYMYILRPGETGLYLKFCPEDENGTHTGYADKKYDLQSGETRDGVVFTNTYTKVAPAPTAKPAQSPKTGDEANLALWLGLGLSAALALGYVSLRKKEN